MWNSEGMIGTKKSRGPNNNLLHTHNSPTDWFYQRLRWYWDKLGSWKREWGYGKHCCFSGSEGNIVKCRYCQCRGVSGTWHTLKLIRPSWKCGLWFLSPPSVFRTVVDRLWPASSSAYTTRLGCLVVAITLRKGISKSTTRRQVVEIATLSRFIAVLFTPQKFHYCIEPDIRWILFWKLSWIS